MWVESLVISLHIGDLLHHVLALYHFAEDAVTPLMVTLVVVQEVVINSVDEELAGSRVWVIGTSHGNSKWLI